MLKFKALPSSPESLEYNIYLAHVCVDQHFYDLYANGVHVQSLFDMVSRASEMARTKSMMSVILGDMNVVEQS